MPTYEFTCPRCNYNWEFTCSIEQYADIIERLICPSCKYDEPKRVFNAVGFVLKGRGWARDGYKSLNDEKKEAEYWAKKADPTFDEPI